jgi:hypothetical protein
MPVDTQDARQQLSHIIQHNWAAVHAATGGRSPSPARKQARQHAGGAAGKEEGKGAPLGRRGWGSILRREAIMLCRAKECGAGAPGAEAAHLPHRLYVQQAGAHVRVATAVGQIAL